MSGVKCINSIKKMIAAGLIGGMVLSLSACGEEPAPIEYSLYDTSTTYGLITTGSVDEVDFFSKDLCIADGADLGTDQVDSFCAWGAGVFNTETGEVTYSQNIHERLYPASTTKILTAILVFKYGDLEHTVTVSELACNQASDSSVADLHPGDQMTERQLLYGLLLRSGNDAAVALAEAVAGDVETFVGMMNEEAQRIGATNSHFVTPNGLHDDDHYTTVYDLYLIMNEAIKYPEFVDMIHTATYDVYYADASGNATSMTWNNTNRYLLDKVEDPEGFTIVGGKTGTTGQAMYCLVLLSNNEMGQPIISVILGADSAGNLYLLMNEILEAFGHAP